ncbi:hypothetical protein H0194_02570 [Corynebacterium incognita]|uniref:Uncharacterized protein n=1 Tax=Corynebacterium incognita TaxID=2754725 RepID=A0A7G7CQS0_9CORY|nr:hypothetical protein [Corynebacterium incognita]QNE89936.1 hypothetical protein H0194_02570 [Corynebacterium incognita]
MTSPLIEFIEPHKAEEELERLYANLDEPIEDFEFRAFTYQLSAKEAAVWERISELRWLLASE